MRRSLLLISVGLFFMACDKEPSPGNPPPLSTENDPYYMVFFTDKEGTPYQLSNPSAFLSARSISRRQKHNVATTVEDLPVVPAYVQGLRTAGALVRHSTRWLNGTLVHCSDTVRSRIRELSYVRAMALVSPNAHTLRILSNKIQQEKLLQPPLDHREMQRLALENAVQNEMLGVDEMHSANFRGEGIYIAVLDAGFPDVNVSAPFRHIYAEDRMVDTYSFVLHTQDIYHRENDNHGTLVLSTMAAHQVDQGDRYEGVAYEATYALYETEDVHSEYRIEEYNWLFAAERADSLGVDIIQSSLGYRNFDTDTMNYGLGDLDGRTAVVTRAAEMAFARGILVVVSAGNSGERGIGAPSDGIHVLGIGGVNAERQIVGFSSRGPTGDGRIKPDVSAMAENVVSVNVTGSEYVYIEASGTSFSSPLVAALAAGLLQALPTKKNNEIATLLKQSGHQSMAPDNLLGYGIPDYSRARAAANP